MVELDLSHNNITNIESKTFEGNERLQTLTLSYNQVKIINWITKFAQLLEPGFKSDSHKTYFFTF